jgi:predicted rRNA methylase YqxC with S4 and FtsJ domains
MVPGIAKEEENKVKVTEAGQRSRSPVIYSQFPIENKSDRNESVVNENVLTDEQKMGKRKSIKNNQQEIELSQSVENSVSKGSEDR